MALYRHTNPLYLYRESDLKVSVIVFDLEEMDGASVPQNFFDMLSASVHVMST